MVGVFSDAQVLSAMESGRVVIHPFNRQQLCTSSYDVRLGAFFFREQHPELGSNIFNILDPEQVQRVWGKPQSAEPAHKVLAEPGASLANIAPEDRIIMLAPGETILAHTEEFIGCRYEGTTMMKARSSLGRSFILVCKCAGWGDIGYFNRWTMEITNVSQRYRIPLVVGMRIAQIAFMPTGPVVDKSYGETGSYQHGDDIETLVKNWRPEMLLPKTKR